MTTAIPFATFHARHQLRRPRVAVSACLAGHDVRYDGTSKAQPRLLQTLGDKVDWCTVCPEVAAGMGVPRPPVQLQRDHTGIRVIEVEAPHRDVSTQLRAGVATSIAALQAQSPDAIVLKARSPSCGLGTTTLVDTGRRVDGLFAAACREHFAHALLLDEEQLATAEQSRCLAVALLLAVDLDHAGAAPPPALLAHYRRFDLDIAARVAPVKALMQQLLDGPQSRIDMLFDALFPIGGGNPGV